MVMSKAETLPEEIIICILYLLPAKFIGQYRCVSKQWRNLLSDPQFIKAHHIIHAHKREEKLIYVSASHALHTITFNHNPQNGTDAISRKLNLPQLSDNWVRVLGSCNGLVLVVNRQNIKYLINPKTLKHHRIPNFDLALPLRIGCSMSGLGYDFASDDYKVVTLSRFKGYEWTIDSTFVDVYSVRMGRWRRLECLPHDHIAHAEGCGILVNGALHWMARKTPHKYWDSSIIVAFDLSDEKFSEVPTPTPLGKGNFGWYNLVALRGCLCMYFTGQVGSKFEVWMMREYLVEESWTKFIFTGPDSLHGFIPLSSMSNDDIVLEMVGEVVQEVELIIYNMKEDQWMDILVDGITSMLKRTGTFMESLDTLLLDAML